MSHSATHKNRAARDDTSPFAPHQDAQPGDLVTFGSYPHTAGGVDKALITWRVLGNSDGELFLLSEFLLDCKRYHADFVDTTWRGCDLRRWLNGEFYDTAFSDDEKSLLQTTLCADNGEGCPDTKDKVFLLSVAEMKELKNSLSPVEFDATWRAVGTEFAKMKKDDGCRLFVYKGSIDAGYANRDGERQGCSWWWLRTQRGRIDRAYFVGVYGSLRGYGRVNLGGYGVRPALRLKVR